MKKNGFVFIESIAVLVVVALSLAMLIASYTLISSRTKQKENYDKSSDKYLLYAINNLVSSDECTYAKPCTINGASYGVDMVASQTTCKNPGVKTKELMFDCEKVFKKFNIKNLYVIHDLDYTLNTVTKSAQDSKNIIASELSNGTIEYIKTLKKCNDKDYTEKIKERNKNNTNYKCNNPITYLIGEFDRGDMYYASIVIDSNEVE